MGKSEETKLLENPRPELEDNIKRGYSRNRTCIRMVEGRDSRNALLNTLRHCKGDFYRGNINCLTRNLFHGFSDMYFFCLSCCLGANKKAQSVTCMLFSDTDFLTANFSHAPLDFLWCNYFKNVYFVNFLNIFRITTFLGCVWGLVSKRHTIVGNASLPVFGYNLGNTKKLQSQKFITCIWNDAKIPETQ